MKLIDLLEVSASPFMAPFAKWIRWWANERTGQIIDVPAGEEHDAFFCDNIQMFLPHVEVDAEANPWDHLDTHLEQAYAEGWIAILFDGNRHWLELNLRVGPNYQPSALQKIFARILRQVPVQSVLIDITGSRGGRTISYIQMDEKAIHTFVRTGRLPQARRMDEDAGIRINEVHYTDLRPNRFGMNEGMYEEPEESPGSFGWWIYPDGMIEEMEEFGTHGVTAHRWLSSTDSTYTNEDYDEATGMLLQKGGIRVSTFHGSDTMHVDAIKPTITARTSLLRLIRETRRDFSSYIVGEIDRPVSYGEAIRIIRKISYLNEVHQEKTSVSKFNPQRPKQLKEIHYTDLYPESFETFHKKYRRLMRRGKTAHLYVQFRNFADNRMDRTAYTRPNHTDPVGTYAYPMNYILRYPADIWYGAGARYLRVIEDESKSPLYLKDLIDNWGKVQRILFRMGLNTRWGDLKWVKRFNHHTGRKARLMTFMRIVQIDYAAKSTTKEYGKTVYPVRRGIEQTKLFLRAGYDCLIDQGTGALNEREPEQTVFLTRGAFRILETYDLRRGKGESPHMTHNGPEYNHEFIRKFARSIAQAMGDQLVGKAETSNLNGWTYLWTKAGRRIEIEIRRPQSYYDRRLGEKPHKYDRTTTNHRIDIIVQTEVGTIRLFHIKHETKLSEIAAEIGEKFRQLKSDPQSTGWTGQTIHSYREQADKDRLTRIVNMRRQEERLPQIDYEAIQALRAQHINPMTGQPIRTMTESVQFRRYYSNPGYAAYKAISQGRVGDEYLRLGARIVKRSDPWAEFARILGERGYDVQEDRRQRTESRYITVRRHGHWIKLRWSHHRRSAPYGRTHRRHQSDLWEFGPKSRPDMMSKFARALRRLDQRTAPPTP